MTKWKDTRRFSFFSTGELKAIKWAILDYNKVKQDDVCEMLGVEIEEEIFLREWLEMYKLNKEVGSKGGRQDDTI